MQDAEDSGSLARIEKIAMAERIKTLELESRSLRAKKDSLQQLVEDVFPAQID